MKNYFEGNATKEEALELFYKGVMEKYPDFCRKISVKYPSNQINTRSGGFVILSDFHGVLALELGV